MYRRWGASTGPIIGARTADRRGAALPPAPTPTTAGPGTAADDPAIGPGRSPLAAVVGPPPSPPPPKKKGMFHPAVGYGSISRSTAPQ